MNRKYFYAVLALIAAADVARSQQLIPIETINNVLVLEVDKKLDLHTLYLGPRLRDTADYQHLLRDYPVADDYTALFDAAFAPSGGRGLIEPAVSVVHADGNPSLDLRYVSHHIDKQGDVVLLSVKLKDPVYDVEVTLFYKSYYRQDVIEQWSSILHHEKGNIVLQKFASADLHLKGGAFWLKQWHGDWAREMQPEESRLTHGIRTLDTKLGTRADLFQPPVFMVSLDHPATEEEGKVLLGGLEWSGNFRNDLEIDPSDNLRIISGPNNYSSAYTLAPGVEFATPAFVYTYSERGKGDASRKLHRWAREYKLMDGKGTRSTLLNNWESTYFNFNEQRLGELLRDTKKLGVDLFLLDDGWFGNHYPRNDDRAGLGDWQENRQKLPNGIASLVREAQQDSVKFGIWIEPEMVNPKSDLYTRHPDWVVRQPRREEYYFRHQLVLDLSNPQVQDFVFGVVDSLFIKAPNLAYIKWDCNAVIYNAWSAHLGKDQSHFYIDYVLGLYKVLARIRAKYPRVPMMLCSGGGGRVDYGALQYFTEYWPSDNTDPLERIFIQWENSYFYPAIASSNHVTDWGRQPLKYRTDVAMMGKLGFDIVVSKLNEQDLHFCQQAVSVYHRLSPVIWWGDQYRLSDPQSDNVASILYVDSLRSTAVLFNYLVNFRYDVRSRLPLRLKGLEGDRRYKVKEIDLYPGTHSSLPAEGTYTGQYLMTVGLDPQVDSRRSSVVIELSEEK